MMRKAHEKQNCDRSISKKFPETGQGGHSDISFCSSEHYDRAAHTYGKSYPDLARGLACD